MVWVTEPVRIAERIWIPVRSVIAADRLRMKRNKKCGDACQHRRDPLDRR